MTQPLFVDLYAGFRDGHADWPALLSLGAPWHGAIIKATEGVSYSGAGWFAPNWKVLRNNARYGNDWFRGAYHFLKFNRPGAAQAEFYLKTIAAAGGWDVGDFWPVVDVELGNEKNTNQLASAQQIIDCTTAFAQKCTAETGRKVILYGNGAMRDRHITDKMGCSYLWCARYEAMLPRWVYERSGWTTEELLMWQYAGDGHGKLPNYPHTVPTFGDADISAFVKDGGLDWLRANLFAEKPA